MIRKEISIGGRELTVYAFNTVVVGAGCAGLAAANRLIHYGQRDIALIADSREGGTSRNAGSDKQTYYKLSLSGNEPDSVGEMARTLFSGGCVDGEHALCEAALSAPNFLRLCELGVPFPMNRYGEYAGYKTDHDPRARATSAGPLTSRFMAEALEREAAEKGERILEGRLAVRILTGEDGVQGLLCLVTKGEPRFEVFLCRNIVWATGGPAGVYRDSCYPLGHTGMSGAAYWAGAKGKNLTEWQYGLASIAPRWNVSGTYMQALPRFVSTDEKGGDAREFLLEVIPDPGRLLTLTFLKGYQWPFDTRKAKDGSSLIDLAVYLETKVKNRRVFLDFRKNPLGEKFDFSLLDAEAYAYLKNAGALLDTPIARLKHMNEPAVALYREKGVDINTQMLEIALCVQHQNGGIAVDAWWQTDVPGLFAVGEAAGTHGVYRPGGSALNAGQAGAERAARFISLKRTGGPAPALLKTSEAQALDAISLLERCLKEDSNLEALKSEAASGMSRAAGAVRDVTSMKKLLLPMKAVLTDPAAHVRIRSMGEAAAFYLYLDTLRTQVMVLAAMIDYQRTGGLSRGAAICFEGKDGKETSSLSALCSFVPDDGQFSSRVQEAEWNGADIDFHWRDVHPIPQEDSFFENVWRAYREHQNVY